MYLSIYIQPGTGGENVTQKGLVNVASALDWIQKQQVTIYVYIYI